MKESFKKSIENARIVALGENSHFIKEFFVLRKEIVEFLVEECGFGVLAFEFGFSEGLEIDKWIKGQGDEGDIKKHLLHFYYPKEWEDTLLWLRKYNKASRKKVDFLGVDLPRNGGSYFPSLKIVHKFIKKYDESAAFLSERAFALASKLDGYSTAQAALALQNIRVEVRNELTTLLTRLLIRLEIMQPQITQKTSEERFNIALLHLKSIFYTDYNIQAMAGFIGGFGLSGDMGAKDKFMADVVKARIKEAQKMILIAHNAHIQKEPAFYKSFLSCVTMGQRLAQSFGDGYRAYAISCESGFTAALYPDESQKFGFRVDNYKLRPSVKGTIEFWLKEAGIKQGFVDFADIEAKILPNKIRFDSMHLKTDMKKAFDGIFILPKSTVSEVVTKNG
ncbi:MAG: erythromycin esterase family protein [Campylobacteraceae bacterium]|jgi:erythromycin esterase|nr:erythromycin esterase family protein [Campylobacteraceae bacterium]